jgi:hypothetical protein
MADIVVVKVNFDADAEVWYTESSDVYGLRIEAATFDALLSRIPGAVQDLLEGDNNPGSHEMPIEALVHASICISNRNERLNADGQPRSIGPDLFLIGRGEAEGCSPMRRI